MKKIKTFLTAVLLVIMCSVAMAGGLDDKDLTPDSARKVLELRVLSERKASDPEFELILKSGLIWQFPKKGSEGVVYSNKDVRKLVRLVRNFYAELEGEDAAGSRDNLGLWMSNNPKERRLTFRKSQQQDVLDALKGKIKESVKAAGQEMMTIEQHYQKLDEEIAKLETTLQTQFLQEERELTEQHEQELTGLKAEHAQKMTELEANLQAEHATDVVAKLAEQTTAHDDAIAQMEEVHSQALEAAKASAKPSDRQAAGGKFIDGFYSNLKSFSALKGAKGFDQGKAVTLKGLQGISDDELQERLLEAVPDLLQKIKEQQVAIARLEQHQEKSRN